MRNQIVIGVVNGKPSIVAFGPTCKAKFKGLLVDDCGKYDTVMYFDGHTKIKQNKARAITLSLTEAVTLAKVFLSDKIEDRNTILAAFEDNTASLKEAEESAEAARVAHEELATSDEATPELLSDAKDTLAEALARAAEIAESVTVSKGALGMLSDAVGGADKAVKHALDRLEKNEEENEAKAKGKKAK